MIKYRLVDYLVRDHQAFSILSFLYCQRATSSIVFSVNSSRESQIIRSSIFDRIQNQTTNEVLPRFFNIKNENVTLEELLFFFGDMEEQLYEDLPCEYHNPSGQIDLDHAKTMQIVFGV
ncbi:hypothetical protein K1719_011026 [Acacia pycnantha]|nr:hypothetical protein K1719_011026 [Acacia pycnantha]